MKRFKQNITNTFRQQGIDWLSKLDHIVKALREYWNLAEIQPVPNMTYHYVAKAMTDNGQPVVLKVGCDNHVVQDEKLALRHFDGCGAIKLLDYHEKYNALLLQQAIPGTTLKSIYPDQLEYVVESYVNTMRKLHSRSAESKAPHVSEWLQAIDRAIAGQLPAALLSRAKALKSARLSSQENLRLLHGDLHLDNLLLHEQEWVAIDPKGIIGEPEFEMAAFDFIAEDELPHATRELFLKRIDQISDVANLSAEKVREWTFIRLILSAAWYIEDRSDPSKVLALAELLSHSGGF